MSKRSFIDSIDVKSPCSEDWNEMKGSDRVRYCCHCDFNVHNISAMTRKDAMRLVRDSDGRVCVHYVKNPDDNTPLFANTLHKITRRASLAAGVLGASLSLSTLAHAQGAPLIRLREPTVQTVEKPNDTAVKAVKTDSPQQVNDEPNDFLIDGKMSFVEYRTGLHRAVSRDDANEVAKLISEGVDVDTKDSNYRKITPLFVAVENGNIEIAEKLLNFGAKINARDADRQTPLMRLDEDATVPLIDLLVSNGAKANLVDNTGNNALILAARSVKTEVLLLLIERTRDIDAKNSSGRTALMEAADEDNIENVRALLNARANVNLEDVDGETALSLTTDEEIEELLKSFGARSDEDQE